MIEGHATSEGTGAYAENHTSLGYRELDGTGLQVSQAGFGGYRVDVSVETHRQALRKALKEGVNLVDTSTNYADGGSERLVGAVLGEMVSDEVLARESVVVVSKIGYLQGENYALSQKRKQEGRPFPDLVVYGEGLEHCIHPEFIQDQLTRSLDRLQLETLDVCLLHNPEYYLSWAQKEGIPLEDARKEYERRIGLAFEHLEKEAAEGRIRWYGISSNTFPGPSADPSFTSLERVWSTAESAVGSEHRFRVVQLPFNLLETGAVTQKNQSTGQSVLEYARERNLGVLINRPLNAISGSRLHRLADVPPVEPVSEAEVLRRIEALDDSEAHFRDYLLSQMDVPDNVRSQLREVTSTATIFREHWRKFGAWERWRELESQFFLPRIHSFFQFMSQTDVSREISRWLESYRKELNAVMEAVDSVYRAEAARKGERIKDWIRSVDSEWADASTLSGTAVRALRSTSGVTSVLVGMRQEPYVDDVLRELSRPVTTGGREDSWARAEGSRPL